VEQAMAAEAASMAAKVTRDIRGLVPTLVDDPRYRLSGTEELVRQFLAATDRLSERFAVAANELDKRGQTAFECVSLYSHYQKGARKPAAAEFGEAVKLYPQSRFEAATYRAMVGLYQAVREPLVAQLAELDIAVMTTGPVGWTAPSVQRLRAAGVRVSSGSDGVRDTWKHYGNADMLERAMFLGMRNRLTTDREMELAFDLCTRGGAEVMRLPDYGLAVGCDADLFTVRAQTIAHVVAEHPVRELVVRRGQVVARDGRCTHPAAVPLSDNDNEKEQ
jgi:hypothetical protein